MKTTSSPKSSKNVYDQAVDDFASKMSNRLEFQRVHGTIISPPQYQLDGGRLKKMKVWASRWEHLPTPWPAAHMKKILNFSSSSRFTEVMEWLDTPHQDHKDLLQFLLVRGLNVTEFIPSARVTLLGYACYSLHVKAVSMMLKHTTPHAARQVLSKKHLLGSSQNNLDLVDGTLLHRLAQRANGNHKKYIKLFSVLIANDPDAVLCLTASKRTPDQLAMGESKDFLLEERQKRQAFLLKNELHHHLHASLDANASKVKTVRKI